MDSRTIQNLEKPLFIFEMANNHMGSVEHGLEIIREFHRITKGFDFTFAFKFQFRDIPTFIRPDYKDRMDIKYVKRFTETQLTKDEWKRLKEEAEKLGFLTICTPFDEKSVDLIEELDFDIIKIGSPSMPDWPLLERIVKTDKPIIASAAAVYFYDLDKVVSFFQHRDKDFALMHCVGEYPTPEENLQLNRITLFKNRYPSTPIGFSTHEDPGNYDIVKLAVAKGATIFEKHVQLKDVNQYSATPKQALEWLRSAQEAFKACGVSDSRGIFTIKEQSDLMKFRRGAFVNKGIKEGDLIGIDDIFFAFPNQEGQLLANDVSKYTNLYATSTLKKNDPIVNAKKVDIREKVYEIVTRADRILKDNKIALPRRLDFSISHHYGIDKFYKTGGVLIDVVNREYCKKLIIMFEGQNHPPQYHKKKEETFYVLGGAFGIGLDGKTKICEAGDVVTIKRGVTHTMTALTDGVLEEISSTHYADDSYYEDKDISKNKNRKTYLTYWLK